MHSTAPRPKYTPVQLPPPRRWYVVEWLYVAPNVPRRMGEYVEINADSPLAAVEHAARMWHLDNHEWRGPHPIHCLRVARTLEDAR